MSPSLLTDASNIFVYSVSPTKDNGAFVGSFLHSSPVATTNYNNGNALYRLSSTPALLYKETQKPASVRLHAPLLLPGASSVPYKYVGAAQKIGTLPDYENGYYMYELSDNNNSTHTLSVSNIKYPNNGNLRVAGSVDGFFSSGTSDAEQAAIAKLSTCANININAGQTVETFMLDRIEPVHFGGRTISWAGETANVSCSWRLVDLSSGGAAVDVSGGATSANSNIIPPHVFNLKPNKSFALLKYIITVTKTYGDGSTCSRTKEIQVNIRLMPDNVVFTACHTTPPAVEWNIRVHKSSAAEVSNFVIPLVGDLDNDGIPEIVCWGTSYESTGGAAPHSRVREILIYKGNDVSTPMRKIYLSENAGSDPVAYPYMNSYEAAPYGLVKTGAGTGLIVVACSDYKLRAYDANGTNVWTTAAGENYGSGSHANGGLTETAVNLSFADFNQDGIPEVYLRNKIYNAETGKLLATATGGSNSGSSFSHYSHVTNRKLSSPVAVDIIGDSRLELVLGNEIYTVDIQSATDASQNSVTLARTITPPSNPSIADGHAQPADFNNDGHVDLLISSRSGEGNNATVSFYVYDVYNDVTSAAVNIPTSFSGKSIPLIGRFNADAVPDVLIQCGSSQNPANEKYLAYTYNPASRSFTKLWGYVPDEDSYSNTATMFDFNQDGTNEILLTDQRYIRILSGGGAQQSSFAFDETTIMQYPVIADVDADGQAEIVSVGSNRLNIFKSANPSSPWSPARRVWNQYMYNSVNVNDDLTVPRYQFNPATAFPNGKQPFNNFLQQQTYLDSDGNPVWALPDFAITETPNINYYTAGDSMLIKNLCIRNLGGAHSTDSIWISVYADSRNPARLIRSFQLPAAINADTVRCYTVKLTGVSSLQAASLHIEANERNMQRPQMECDSTGNNHIDLPFSSMLIARNDRTMLFACETKSAGVLNNDLNAAGGTIAIKRQGRLGTALVSGSSIVYSHTAPNGCAGYSTRRDTVRYEVCRSGNCSEAELIVNLLRRPSIRLSDSCSRRPYLTLDYQYHGSAFEWFVSPNGIDGWAPVSAGNPLRVYVNAENWYKVRITLNGDVIETVPAHFVINRKSRLQGNLWWYDSRLVQ